MGVQVHRDEPKSKPEAVRPEPTWPRVANNAIFALWSLGAWALIVWLVK